MSTRINISYVISTYNRLSFLEITLLRLIENLTHGEEIIVVDGNSNDGSKLFLEKLFREGKIHQYISEPDKNQAHGWNKAMLMAKGTIIKKIIDDDVFDLSAIRKCAEFMLNNHKVDVVISNDLACPLSEYKKIEKHSRLKQYKEWENGSKPSFSFGDVHLLIRRSSLSYLGLYATNFKMIDWEYSLRISYLKAIIVYYTGYNALSVYHDETVSAKKTEDEINEQTKKACVAYEYAGDRAEISLWSKAKIAVGRVIYKENKIESKANANLNKTDAYKYLYERLAEINKSGTFTFLTERLNEEKS